MDALRTPPGDADVTCCPAASGGRVALCRLLLEQPDLLLLDEPTTTSTPRACSGWSSISRSTPAPCLP